MRRMMLRLRALHRMRPWMHRMCRTQPRVSMPQATHRSWIAVAMNASLPRWTRVRHPNKRFAITEAEDTEAAARSKPTRTILRAIVRGRFERSRVLQSLRAANKMEQWDASFVSSKTAPWRYCKHRAHIIQERA